MHDRKSLFLLKSVDPPEIAECERRSSEAENVIGSDRLFAWAEAGLVDRQFPIYQVLARRNEMRAANSGFGCYVNACLPCHLHRRMLAIAYKSLGYK